VGKGQGLADQRSPRLLKRPVAYDLLVIDELGCLTLQPEQANAFFKLMDQRYNRKATIITTNLDYPEWRFMAGFARSDFASKVWEC